MGSCLGIMGIMGSLGCWGNEEGGRCIIVVSIIICGWEGWGDVGFEGVGGGEEEEGGVRGEGFEGVEGDVD